LCVYVNLFSCQVSQQAAENSVLLGLEFCGLSLLVRCLTFGATGSTIGPLTHEYEANNGPTEAIILENKDTRRFQDGGMAS